MPKFSKGDQERIAELVTHIHTLVGRKLVKNEKDPLLLVSASIEGHRGRVEKAIRLLCDSGHIKYAKTETKKIKTFYSQDQQQTFTYYEVLTIDQTKDTPPREFDSTFEKLYHRACEYHESAEDFSMVGYDEVETLGVHVLHVHWHPELYDFYKDGTQVLVYPKALQDARCRSILRSIIERHISIRYADILAQKIGLPENSIPSEDYKEIKYRSCGHTLGMLSEAGMESYLQEYEFRIKYFQNLMEGIKFLQRQARAAGGFEDLIKQIRLEMIVQLKREAPKYMNQPEDLNRMNDKLVRHCESVFLINNPEHWNYEDLYGQDASVLHLSDHMVEFDQHDKFEPDEDDMRVVSATPDQFWVTQPKEEEVEEPA